MKVIVPALFLAIAATAWPQEVPTFSSKVNVVSLLATVHDRDGRVVKNLTSEDFALQEDGAPQTIHYFHQESDLPLTIGLLVDTSRSQTGVLEQERQASYTFLDQVLRPEEDQAFIAHFDTRVEILQGLTSSRSELQNALSQLRIPDQAATLLFSAIQMTSEEVMRPQSGRKAFIILTDGVAFHDRTTLETAIEFAQRADAIIFPIRFADSTCFHGPLRTAIRAAASEEGKKGLQRMAKETGGVYYQVKEGQTLEQIYAQIEDALRNQYSLGYTPPHPNDGKFHKINLTAKDHKLVVHTRAGYYAK
jgi:VWFA-related protein